MTSDLHDAIDDRNPDRLSAAVYSDLVPRIPSDTDPATWDPRELGASGGNVWGTVAWRGKLWERDDDSTASADELTCIILLDGGHYLTDDVQFPQVVESRVIDTPPDADGSDPSVIGKAWRLPQASVDAWAGHDNDVALGTANGWKFHTPNVGEIHYIRAEKIYEHFSEDDQWEDGIPMLLADGTVPPAALIWDRRVQDQTTDSPPATWSKGVAYIIGSSASGDWSGDAGKIAIALSDGVLADGDEFYIRAGRTGEIVYDIALGIDIRWNGVAWVSAAGAIVFSDSKKTASGSTSVAGAGNRSYSATVAPTTALAHRIDNIYHERASLKSGAKIKFNYRAYIAPGGDVGLYEAGIYRDTEVDALDWVPILNGSDAAGGNGREINLDFEIETADTNSHRYYVRFSNSTGATATNIPDFTRRLFSMDEYA